MIDNTEIDTQRLTKNEGLRQKYNKIFGITIASVLSYILLTSIIFPDEFRKFIFRVEIFGVYPYFLSLSLVLLLFSGVLLWRSISMGHSSLFIMITAVLLSGLSYLFGYLNFDPTGTVNFRETRLFQLQILSQTISVFLFYLHYELSSYDRPRTGFLLLNVILLWPYSLFNLYHLVTDNYEEGGIFSQLELVSLFLLQLGVIIIFSWLLYNAYHVSKLFLLRENFTSLGASLQLSGIIILVLGVFFQFVETVVPFLDVWHTPLNTAAILLIVIPYIRNANVMIFSPVNVMVMGVIDSSGRTMYFQAISDDFADKETLQTTSELFGGLTLAFNSMGQEVARSEKGVDSLQFADRSIIVEFLQPYYLVVIANKSTYFMQKEMEEYLLELKEEYPEVPKDGRIIPEKIFRLLNQKFFPITMQVTDKPELYPQGVKS